MIRLYVLGVSLAVLASTPAWAQTAGERADMNAQNVVTMNETAAQARGMFDRKTVTCKNKDSYWGDLLSNIEKTQKATATAALGLSWTNDVEGNGRFPQSDTAFSFGSELDIAVTGCYGAYKIGLGTNSRRFSGHDYMDGDVAYGLMSASFILDGQPQNGVSIIKKPVLGLSYNPIIVYDSGFSEQKLTLHSLRASLSFQFALEKVPLKNSVANNKEDPSNIGKADQAVEVIVNKSTEEKSVEVEVAKTYITPAIGVSGNIVAPGEFNQVGAHVEVAIGHLYSDELSVVLKPAFDLRYYDDFFGMSRTDKELSAELAVAYRPENYKQFDLSVALRIGKTWSNVDVVDFDRVDVIAPMIKATWAFYSGSGSN